jgi:D-lyxose ketol-isomerase
MKRSDINEILGHTRQFFPCTTFISRLCQLSANEMAAA